MAIDPLAGDLMDVVLDACPGDASLLGVRDREDWLIDYAEAGTEAGGSAHSARQVVDTGLHVRRIRPPPGRGVRRHGVP